MTIARIDGKAINYWTGLEPFIEGREYVLFVHGAGGGQYTWSYQKGFFKKAFNPIILELPGHGASEGEGETDIERYAEHVYRFVSTLHLPKLFLVGHSMGGAIVQTLALRHPEILKGIILVGTGARLRVLPMILNETLNRFEEVVKKINELAFSSKTSSELIERGILGMMACRPEVVQGDFSACDRFDVMKEVEKITLPTLIICGDDDQLTPVKYSQFLHDRIKGSRLEIIPGAGHMVMMESPSIFNEKIREFILSPIFSESR